MEEIILGTVDLKELGIDIKETRINRNLSQVTVARYCGVSIQAYQRWENGLTKFVKKQHFEKLKEILCGDIEYA